MPESGYGLSPSFLRLINDRTFTPDDVGKVLDVGCGRGALGGLLRAFRDPTHITGIDAHRPYIERCKKTGIYDHLFQHDLAAGLSFLPDDEFDHVYCVNVIEHLKRPDALCLIDEIIRVGGRVVMSTETEFHPQPALEGNPFQRHLSHITIRDFRARGFRVRGIGPFKHLRNLTNWRVASVAPNLFGHIVAVRE